MTAGGGLGEFGRIARFFRPLAASVSGALGLADDAAVLTVEAGLELVVTTDAIVAGVHFLASDAPEDIARKALRVNLSDLAAKGATPYAYTLTLALGREIGDAWVERFAAGLAEDQSRFGIGLVGGDSVSTEGPIWVSVTAFGLTESGRMVRRSGARPGDRVFVTGTIGDAALGLAIAQARLAASAADRAYLLGRYTRPEPRVALAEAIGRYAHAGVDISDGLAADFGHLCRASRVDGVIEIGRVPLSDAALRLCQTHPDLWSLVLGGGDDYEVLFTIPAENEDSLRAAALAAAIPLTEIGRIGVGTGQTLLIDANGSPVVPAKAGWTHA